MVTGTMSLPYRALIVDDDDDMRLLVSTTIELRSGDLAVAGEAADADAAEVAWRRDRPDVIVVDYSMPGRTGLELAADILAEDPLQSIVLFSAHLTDDMVSRAEELGVRACVSKDAYRDLPDIIRHHGGGRPAPCG